MGNKLAAKLVFSLVIRYLKDDLLKECHKQLADTLHEDDIRWVLTVPAIWNDAAKQFMREAAEEKLERRVLLEDEMGNKLAAKLVFSLVIRYLKDDLLKECHKQLADTLHEDDIRWVLTVPAIWNDAAKQFMREAAEEKLERRVLLEDEMGNKLAAKLVFSLVIRYLKDDLLKECHKQLADTLHEDDIRWVLTVPAIWNDAAKQFMREAAEEAGIKGTHLVIALEPEAASLYCLHLPVQKDSGGEGSLASLRPGTKYIVLDAGGGTIDVTVHQLIIDDKLREIHRASGGAWGGTKVDEEYERFLVGITGPDAMTVFKKEHMDDYIDIFRTFEVKKREIPPSSSDKITFRIPPTLAETVLDKTENTVSIKQAILSSEFREQVTYTSGKLRVEADVARSFFKKSVDSIVRHVSSLLQDSSVHDCSAILMVGGFSESQILHDAMRKHFPKMTLIFPDGAGIAVLKGAVIFGHCPKTITERICKYTYGDRTTHKASPECKHPTCRTTTDEDGTLRCHDIFRIHAVIGQTVKLGEEQPEQNAIPVKADQSNIGFKIYASTSANPMLVKEPVCTRLGKLRVKISDTKMGTRRKFGIRFIFGGTEIAVKVEDKATKQIYVSTVDCLE